MPLNTNPIENKGVKEDESILGDGLESGRHPFILLYLPHKNSVLVTERTSGTV